ncbi:MAG: polynucleotide adenylyltransferase PcnB [Myxococcaceae bacterium]
MSRDSTAAPAADVPPELTPTEDAVETDLRGSDLPSEGLSVEASQPTASAADLTPPNVEIDLRATLPRRTPTGAPAEIDPLKLDLDALKVVTRLRQHGHQAYFVGGCVRDLMLGAKPKDFDVATSAHPGEVRAIFRNCRLIGRRFRLAHVYFKGGKIIEVSTFRANPSEVEEVQAELEGNEDAAGEVENDLLITHDNVFGTAEQDARRRDFTINGLFYDIGEARVIDYVRGRRDLRERLIRTIGDPEVRMREDPIRILRAVRFACKLSIDIESRTYAAMEGAVEDLPRCAPPRLLEDTFRLLRGGVAAPALKLIAALDALRILLPPVHQYLRQHGPEGEKTFYAYAAALDEKVRSAPAPIEDSILLAALLLPIMQAAPNPEQPTDAAGRPSVAQVIEDLLNDFVRTARLPRRIAERCRSILIAQRTLTGERRRRGSLNSFRNHPLFNEALAVFEISVEARGQFRGELDAWKSGAAPAPKPGAEGPTRRRRRRRRRGGGGAATNGASTELNRECPAIEASGGDEGEGEAEPLEPPEVDALEVDEVDDAESPRDE